MENSVREDFRCMGQEIQPGILKVAKAQNSQKVFSLSWEKKGKEKLYVISVFCINKDDYFKIVWIISGGSTSSSIGWMWLWVGVLSIHSKKRSGNSFPWDELFWTWKWAKRLGSDFWPFGWMMPKLPSAHCNSITYAALPVFWDHKLVKIWAWETPWNVRFDWIKFRRYSHTACHLEDLLTEGLLNVNLLTNSC